MPRAKPSKREKHAAALSAAEEFAVGKFTAGLKPCLGRLRRTAEQVQELLGRWEQVAEGTPGLLGGNLLALVNEEMLGRQLELLSEEAAQCRREPGALADHADFFGGLLGEYAALLSVLAGIELEPESPLARDWEKVSEELLQHGAEIQERAEELELELEDAEEPPGSSAAASGAPAGLRPASRAFLREIWQKTQAEMPLGDEPGRLARVMLEHPEYSAAWESESSASEQDYTIGGVNPFVHVTMHVAVERQIDADDPPETAATLARLTAAGLDRHEAVHRIANVLAEQIWRMQRDQRSFDRAAYLRALNQLKP